MGGKKKAPHCTTVGLHSASSEKHENCTAWNIKSESNRMCEDPLVQKCMCPTYTSCSRMHAEKHYLFLPYRDLERNPNNIRIVVNYTFKITLKVSGLKAPDEIIHGLSYLIKFSLQNLRPGMPYLPVDNVISVPFFFSPKGKLNTFHCILS